VPKDRAVAEIRQVDCTVAETPKVVVTVVVAEAGVEAKPSIRTAITAARESLMEFMIFISSLFVR
jgi:hypothetical protein